MLLRLDTSGYGRGGVCGQYGKRYVIFIDECHKMKSWEPWYEPLQSCQIFYQGKSYWLPDFTFIGATTDCSKIPKSAMDRIPTKLRLESYSISELSEMIMSHYLGIQAKDALYIAERSRQVARVALNYAGMYLRHGSLSFFDTLGIDSQGLGSIDRSYLAALRQYQRPLSLNTLAALTGAAPREITDVVEPYLKALGLIEITPGGRCLIGGTMDLSSRTEKKLII